MAGWRTAWLRLLTILDGCHGRLCPLPSLPALPAI